VSNVPRGASAARIIIEDDRVTKLDTAATGTRVRRQGLWLRDYPNSHLPRVERITSAGYEMNRLRDVDLGDFLEEPMHLLEECWRIYCKMRNQAPHRQWARNPFVALDERALDQYVVDLCLPLGAYAALSRLHELRPEISWPAQLMWTHGDPILDNVMRDDEGHVVFIDAIPPCPALPSLDVVDFGRFIQSAAGYEQIRYAGAAPKQDVIVDRVSTVLNWISCIGFDSAFNVDQVQASLFYSVIHMLRGARTCRDDDDRATMISVATTVLLGELESWML
jgi:hypothetical protein